MPLEYLPPPASNALRQGEIIAGIWEHQSDSAPVEVLEGSGISFDPISHPLLMVMTPDCDLLWDYEGRIRAQSEGQPIGDARDDPGVLPHVLLCDLFSHEEIRPRFTGQSDIWRRIRQNQNERYHHLPTAPVGDTADEVLPDLYLDFKKILTLPTHRFYEGLESASIKRLAIMPPIYLQDLMHRFYAFLGRVGVPD